MSDSLHDRTCPECGTRVPSDTPEGQCPRCLMAQIVNPTRDGDHIPPLTIEELAPHFPQLEILECLGRGGMGVVYKARQKSLNRLAALKLLAPECADDPHFAQRFEKEAHALAALNHPHIVGVFDFGRAGGFFYLLMEFVDGVNLRQAMKAGRFTPEQALAVVPPVCEALQYAHEHGIVHRDIKPENLLLDKTGRVKIADFGIAKLVGNVALACDGQTSDDEEIQQRSQTGATVHDATLASVAGTPQYMSPEQKSHGVTDHRADIYSLGVVLYEMLTGELPADKLQPPSRKVRIDVRLDEIVLRALEKTPALRYQTAGEFRTVVETMAGGGGAPPIKQNHASVQNRFSRTSIVGACWAFAGILHFLMPTLGYRMKSEFVPVTMSILGLSAPIGATILGWLGVWQIRRSAGRLHGLWLAVLDGLFFPLLLLVAAVAFALRLLISELGIGFPESVNVGGLALLACSPLCWLIIRRVWCAVKQPLAGDFSATTPAVPQPPNRKALTVGFGIMTLCILCYQMVLNPPKRRDQAQAITPPDMAVVARNLAFGPVIEREIFSNESLAQAFLDLDTGNVLSAPPEIASQLTQGKLSTGPHDPIIRAWMRSSGADLVPQAINPPMLVQVDGRVVRLVMPNGKPNSTPFETVTAAEVLASLGNNRSVTADASSENVFHCDPSSRSTFVTREGAKGILEITGMEGRSVKLRYKLVQGGSERTPTTAATFESVTDAARKLIARYFPDAVITATGDEFKARHDTREYEVHGQSKTGEVAQKAQMETGPTTKGFVLTVVRQNEIGQAELPQFFDRPYWKTYGNLAIDPQTGLGVAVYFDFGSALNPEFKAAVLELLKLADSGATKSGVASTPETSPNPAPIPQSPVAQEAFHRSETAGQKYVESFRAPFELEEVGPLSLVFTDAQKRILKLCVDSHLGPSHFGEPRLLLGVTRSDDPEALLAASGGKTEKMVLSLLNQWWLEHANLSRGGEPMTKRVKEVIMLLGKRNSTARLQFRLIANDRDAEAEPVPRRYAEGRPNVSREVLLDETSVSSATVVENGSGPSVLVKFTEAGAKKFAIVTGANVGKQLAIVFDNGVIAEPTIAAAITDGSALISGNFDTEDADRLAATLTAAIQTAAERSKPDSNEDR